MSILSKVRSALKTQYDKLANNNLKKNILHALPFWVGALLTGLVAVLYAKIFQWAEHGTLTVYNYNKWLFFGITPLCFLLAWWLVVKYAPFARGSGIPQVSAAIELSNPKHNYAVTKLLGIRIIIIKVISSVMLIFGGGVTGREGPTIQISASIFKAINDRLPEWYPKISKRNMIVTGAAAGLASAFNTPLGGIVFAIEELTKTHFSFFKSALLAGVIIAGLTALYLLGPYLYLGYPAFDNTIGGWIFLSVIAVAIIGGIGGSGMGKIVLFILRKKSVFKKQSQKIMYVIICGLIIAALGVLINYQTFGSGKEIMVETLFTGDKNVEWYVPLLRFFGPIITFSSGAAGGIFAPSLSAGASIGSVLSDWLTLSPTETNVIMLCGMTAFLTGITRSPFTSSILVIEMTNSHNIIFYLMLTALVSSLVANLVSRHSFYDHLKDEYIKEIHREEEQISEEQEKLINKK